MCLNLYAHKYFMSLFFQCDCSFEYDDMLFHIIGHKYGQSETVVRSELHEYLSTHHGLADLHAKDYLRRKGTDIEDFMEFVKRPGNRCDEVGLYFLARELGFHYAVIGKTTVYFSYQEPQDTAPHPDVDFVFVYLGKSVYHNTKPLDRPPLLSNPPEPTPRGASADQDPDYVPEDSEKKPRKPKPKPKPPKPAHQYNTRGTKGLHDHKAPSAPPPPAPPAAQKKKKRKRKPRTIVVKTKHYYIRKPRVFVKKCTLCPQSFKSQALLNEHTQKDHQGYKFMCQRRDCGKEYTSQLALSKHEKTHGNMKHQCPNCPRSYPYKSELERHITVHSLAKNFPCKYPRCKVACKTQAEYHRHYGRHAALPNSFICEVCEKGFRFRKNLLQHTSLHSEELEFKCDQCNARFKWRSSLRYHVQQDHVKPPARSSSPEF